MSPYTIELNGNQVTVVPLPTTPAPRMVEPWYQDSVAMVTFPFTGQTQAQGSTGADLWGMMMTYAPLTSVQAAPLLAWLLGMRGMFNAVQLAPPEYTGPQGTPFGFPVMGSGNLNLVADSNLLDAWTYWTNAGGGFNIAANTGGGGGTNAFQVISATVTAAVSAPIAVVPGQTYTLSCYIQNPAYAVGPSGAPIAVEVLSATAYIAAIIPSGAGSAQTYTSTFLVPAGVTSVTVWASPQGSTWASGACLFSSFQLVEGSAAIPYTPWLAALVGTVQTAAATTIKTSGWPLNAYDLLLPFDCIQIGYRLHRVLDAVSSDANGNATFRIWPSLREDQAAGVPIVYESPVGLFRLAANKRSSSTDTTHLTHLSFPLVEYR